MIFSFTDADFVNPQFVKCIYGVAGRGKSSVVVDYLKTNDIPFLWSTSTNKLKRDAMERYNINAATTCSALFRSENGMFYIDEKTPDVKTIVIDEILQTSVKVIDWIENHVGEYNIICLTDMKQMLAKGVGREKNLLQKFCEMLQKSYVITDEDTSTKRARDQETKDKIEELYSLPGNGCDAFLRDLKSKRFPVIMYEDMEFNTHDVFITHKNTTEDFLYRDKHLSRGTYNADELIPKGSLASKPPKDYTRHPIMSQRQAEIARATAYYQLANVGSCTRYQGSECDATKKLYYIITPTSKITNREWYTVVSRCWLLDSIVIVVYNDLENRPMTTFRGRKIKDQKILTIWKGEAAHESTNH